MHARLLDFLMCPDCLPGEVPLRLQGGAVREDDDILSGHLECPRCSHTHNITDGTAVVLPQNSVTSAAQLRYETAAALGSYLWTHFGDITAEDHACDAYASWAGMLQGGEAPALDAGSAMGRITMELAARCGFAVGVDFSRSFVRTSRELWKNGRIDSRIVTEGRLTREFSVELPDRLRQGVAEFIVADAMALPFPAGAFKTLSSLNLLDKICRPLDHVHELFRVAMDSGSTLLIADPFSWAEEICPPEDWLGGTEKGEFAGRARDNLERLLAGDGFQIRNQEPIWWTIRNHDNHYETIRSWTTVAGR